MSATANAIPTYHFETSNLIFSFGMKVLMLVIVCYLLAIDLPTAPFPANEVRKLFGTPLKSNSSG